MKNYEIVRKLTRRLFYRKFYDEMVQNIRFFTSYWFVFRNLKKIKYELINVEMSIEAERISRRVINKIFDPETETRARTFSNTLYTSSQLKYN